MHGNTKKHWRLSLVQVRNVYWLLEFSLRHEERETHNFYYADCSYIALQSTPQLNSRPRVRISTHWPNKRAAHPVDHNSIGLAQVRISTSLVQRQISTHCFFQNSTKIPCPLLPGMTSFTPQSYFLSGVFIMIFVIVTSSAHERELHSMCAPARALSRIVLSLTKPNDKI